jgi:phosphoribosylformimino-5-aminoimidazole carboxamide ribonucleotide (ProFAR) isomerase
MNEEIWSQQSGEPDIWYSRFQQYMLMPGKRSLLALCNDQRDKKGAKKINSISGAWTDAYNKFEWKKRSQAWDAHKREEDMIRWEERRKEWKEKQWTTAEQLLEKTQQMLQYPLVTSVSQDGKTIINPAKWSFRDAAAFMETASNLVQSASGASSIDELEALKKLVDAGWIPYHILEEASKGTALLKESVQKAFKQQ